MVAFQAEDTEVQRPGGGTWMLKQHEKSQEGGFGSGSSGVGYRGGAAAGSQAVQWVLGQELTSGSGAGPAP